MASRQSRPESQSRTQVETEAAEERERSLRLVGQNTQPAGPTSARPRVTWTDETVDNEHLNRKKSKICCIFHPNDEEVCESSAEEEYSSPSSSSESSSESDSDSDAPPSGSGPRPRRAPRPNAYERQPRLRPRPHSHGPGAH